MQGYNGIYWGFAPDDSAGTPMSKINGDTGKKASTWVDTMICDTKWLEAHTVKLWPLLSNHFHVVIHRRSAIERHVRCCYLRRSVCACHHANWTHVLGNLNRNCKRHRQCVEWIHIEGCRSMASLCTRDELLCYANEQQQGGRAWVSWRQ